MVSDLDFGTCSTMIFRWKEQNNPNIWSKYIHLHDFSTCHQIAHI